MAITLGHVEWVEMDKNGWNVGQAKQQFSEVLRRSESEPQLIYRRNRLVAAVVAMDESKVAAVRQKKTIGDWFEEARALFREEKYQLPRTRRTSRPNDVVRVLDDISGRHERSE
jgi:antitoxin (DNA-binding transcriptional repressor) of toxin-antitoxin stability system